MCGIAGLVYRERRGRVPQPNTLRAMMDAIAHRGPDDEGIWTDGGVALGHKRLSIIDVATGHQPMSNDDESVWIVFNGEIYNYLELREDLTRRYKFRTQSDTEVLLRLYEELGEKCLEKLNGMFAFAIWDVRQQKLFAARDRLGIKPFYWHQDGERLAFASEPKALIRGAGVAPTPDQQGLEEYLTFQFCLGDRTLFQGIRRLEPGCYFTYRPWRDDAPAIVQYWDFNYDVDTHHTSEYYVDTLLALLQDSVRLQLRSDVPVGAHLSGGIDSSTVVCMASAAYSGTFHTFTGGFRDGPQYDETHYARIVATQVHSAHHEVWPTAQELADQLPGLIYMMDEPAAGPGLFPQYAVSRLARQHVKVVLGGQGGDEMFGGYARYLVAYLEQVIKGTIFGTQEEDRHVVTWEGIAPNLPLLRQYRPLMQTYFRDGLFDEMDRRYFRLVSRFDDVQALISDDAWRSDSSDRMFESFSRVFNNPATKSYFNKMTNFDLKTLLPALLHVEDRTSMAVSLESRVPLLDHRIAELVTRMPPATRFRGGDTKRVFREAVRQVLPAEVFNRRDKMGFPVPLAEWARGPLRDFVADVLLSKRASERGLYRMDGVRAVIAGDHKFGRQLWGLLCMELWLRAFVDGEGQPLPRQA